MNSPKTILITGASTGIGKETAILFAKKGWNVVATMRTPEKGIDLLVHSTIKIVRLDVTDQESIAQALEIAFETFPTIDVLFNNAGYALAGTFEAMTPEFWLAHLPQMYSFVNNVFRENFAYTPIDYAAFERLCGQSFANKF